MHRHRHGESMECCSTGHHGMGHMGGCCDTKIHRHFLTKEEKLEQLEEYKDQLAKELAGVEERIKELKKG